MTTMSIQRTECRSEENAVMGFKGLGKGV